MEKDIGRIPKNDRADIVIRVDDFGGRKGLTIREFVTSDRYTGFTKSGVKIPAEHFKNFKEMINSISDEDMQPVEETKEFNETSEKEKELPTNQQTLNNTESQDKEEMPDY